MCLIRDTPRGSFVLQPACDVAAHYRDPRFGWDLQQLAFHLDQGLPSLSLVGGEAKIRRDLLTRLEDDYGIDVFFEPKTPEPLPAIGNVPAIASGDSSQRSARQSIPATVQRPWVSAFLPELPDLTSDSTGSTTIPRLGGPDPADDVFDSLAGTPSNVAGRMAVARVSAGG